MHIKRRNGPRSFLTHTNQPPVPQPQPHGRKPKRNYGQPGGEPRLGRALRRQLVPLTKKHYHRVREAYTRTRRGWMKDPMDVPQSNTRINNGMSIDDGRVAAGEFLGVRERRRMGHAMVQMRVQDARARAQERRARRRARYERYIEHLDDPELAADLQYLFNEDGGVQEQADVDPFRHVGSTLTIPQRNELLNRAKDWNIRDRRGPKNKFYEETKTAFNEILDSDPRFVDRVDADESAPHSLSLRDITHGAYEETKGDADIFGFPTSYSILAPEDPINDGVVPIESEPFNFHGMADVHMQMFRTRYINIRDTVEENFMRAIWAKSVQEAGPDGAELLYQQRLRTMKPYVLAEAKRKFMEAARTQNWGSSDKLDRNLYGKAHMEVQAKGVSPSQKRYSSLVSSLVDTNAEKLKDYAEHLFMGDTFIGDSRVLKRPIRNEQSVSGAISADQFLLDQENRTKSSNQLYGEGNLQHTNREHLSEEGHQKLHADS